MQVFMGSRTCPYRPSGSEIGTPWKLSMPFSNPNSHLPPCHPSTPHPTPPPKKTFQGINLK